MSGSHEYMSSFLELGMALGVGFSLYVAPIRRHEAEIERRLAAAEAYWARSAKSNASNKRVELKRLRFRFALRASSAKYYSRAVSAGSLLGVCANGALIVLLGARNWVLVGPHFGLVTLTAVVWYVLLAFLAWAFAKRAFVEIDQKLSEFHAR